MGSILTYLGQCEEALTWFTRAREINPYFDVPWYWRDVARAYMVMKRHQEALSALSHARASSHTIAAFAAGCHARLGHIDRARVSVAECLTMKPDFSIRQFMKREPFRAAADAAQIEDSLRLAGLPD